MAPDLETLARTARRNYERWFPDQEIVKQLTQTVGEILEGLHPDDAHLSLGFTVGDVREATGFYTDTRIVEALVSTFTSRAIRMICQEIGLLDDSFPDPDAFWAVGAVIRSTEPQTRRVVPQLIEACIQRFGVPDRVNERKIKEIQEQETAAVVSEFSPIQ